MLKDDAPVWLERLADKAEAYVRDLLGVGLKLRRRADLPSFPRFLTDQFAFIEGQLLETGLLFMAQPAGKRATPANIARLWREADRRADRPVVYLAETISPFNRRRLLEQRTPFLIPGNQLFLPGLAVDLRETFRAAREARADDLLSPAAQKVVLAALLGQRVEGVSASVLARRFKYSPMTMSRAFDDLRHAGLAETEETGNERRLQLAAHGERLWRLALPTLRSPVRKVRRLKRLSVKLPGLMSGESALAELTALAEPRTPVVAVPASAWPRFEARFGQPADEWDERGVLVETWSYDPEALSEGRIVDRLSLYLSLRGHEDERVNLALQSLLEEMRW
jgi:DNA-binding transcriptional ArsR family regulator